jgi:hypothetical protein
LFMAVRLAHAQFFISHSQLVFSLSHSALVHINKE